ncbi:ATP-binding cassette domain-containing protein [Saccharothrix violaceirubra]|uniref:ABC-2 type transport system ATP-binding protein n=1 Tax=Saccharothrix violaceirubra TaxID=413306 RepID=A0A7W7T7G8_9PSEU|nr:ATP-binding cassette domain-containing protein [Saccharothrix violaceirubra]MBB4967751.1 ABC-2 type transport system ATP-binding protein [Saccharothrix violaceirubra]
MYAIEAEGLARVFGQVEAVRSVDLAVRPGEVVGFLGPNGAGKTTTLRMLATVLAPTGGRARVAGHDLRAEPDRVRRRIGYVAQSGGTRPLSTPREELVLQGLLHRLPDAARRADVLLDDFGLGDARDRPVATLSGGRRRRLDVALGLVHRPEVLFLDEPSTGLDPGSRAALWDHVRALDATVFVSTHYLDEADALCSRVSIMDQGRIVAEDSPGALKAAVGHDTVVIGLAGHDVDVVDAVTDLGEASLDGDTLTVTCRDGARLLPDLVRRLGDAGAEIRSVVVRGATLDDVFEALTC